MNRNEPRIPLNDLLAALPPEPEGSLLEQIQGNNRRSGQKIVVLDDDPTGTQTVHDVAVLTEWPVEALVSEFEDKTSLFYLLTNSRSMSEKEARALHAQIGENLRAAYLHSGQEFTVISRSDSTLRGHFPSDLSALSEGLGQAFDAWLLVPFFLEGGRYTANNVHYVDESGWLTPVGQTEFARDKTFGFQSSSLLEWVAEKTGGQVRAEQVATITIDDLRLGGPKVVTRRLLDLPRGTICVVNAVSYRDLEVLVLGLQNAEAQGKRYLYHTAASFVRVQAGIEPRALLGHEDFDLSQGSGGLIIAGSYIPKTSAQLERLMEGADYYPVEVNVQRLLDEGTRDVEIQRAVEVVNRRLNQDESAVVYTSRSLVSVAKAEANLEIGQVVSSSLVAITRGLAVRPRYLLAKGGITSSDIATRALGIRRAVVLGQILPGVPVWQTGTESRYPGMPYIVFPGNVGGQDALLEIARKLNG